MKLELERDEVELMAEVLEAGAKNLLTTLEDPKFSLDYTAETLAAAQEDALKMSDLAEKLRGILQ